MKLPPAVRKHLHRRIARELLWNSATAFERDVASRQASTCLDAIEDGATSASTLKRAAVQLVEKMEKSA